jgi:hypothetical protein
MITPAIVREKLNAFRVAGKTPAYAIASVEAASEWENCGILVRSAPICRTWPPTISGIPLFEDIGAVGLKFIDSSGHIIGEIS